MSGIEWILILSIHLAEPKGNLSEIEWMKFEGFSSVESCKTAAQTLSEQIAVHAGQHRASQGIKPNTRTRSPEVRHTCTLINK